jgi:hypothetical protein
LEPIEIWDTSETKGEQNITTITDKNCIKEYNLICAQMGI